MYALSICLSRAHHSPRCSPISSRHSFPKPALAIYFSIKSNPQKILSRTAFQNPVLTVSPLSLSLSTQSTTRIPCPPACTSKNSSNTHPGTNFLPKSGKYSSPGMLLLRISWWRRQSILLQRIRHQPQLCGSIIIEALIFAPKKPFHPWIAERCNQRNSTSTLHVG